VKPEVLVVDDDADTVESLAEYLSLKGYEPTTAGTLELAQEAMEQGHFEAILLDLNLPDGNGMGWIEALREEHPHLAIVVITGEGDIPTAVDAMRKGADTFLPKPINPQALSVFLERGLEVERLRRRDERQRRLSTARDVHRGESPAAARAWELAATAARNEAAVLIQGETGTGKGVLAKWIHDNSNRSAEAFVEVNCSSLRGDLLASELFGHRKGAFTSAIENREGLVEYADAGTLFLDEIGDMDLAVQAQFLKVIEERKFRRVGETKMRRSEFRLICATNKNLAREAEEGRFRQDLYYRICVFPIEMPPLRERRDDIPDLADELLRSIGQARTGIGEDAMARFLEYEWPGNIRELRNVLERACMIAAGQDIRPEHLLGLSHAGSDNGGHARPGDWTLEAAEGEHIRRALDHFDGRVRDAAKALGVSRATLYRKAKKHGLLEGRGD
jgi:DNA-binding NtrC family response regulator